MSQTTVKKLIKIGKIFLISIFIMFFIIILIQSINITNLKNKKSNLEIELNNKIVLNENINKNIENINNDFDKFSEEELRKDNYKKQDEIIIS